MTQRRLRGVDRRSVRPQARLMALASARSPSTVPVAWALTWSMSPGASPASWIACVIARPARSPVGSGSTAWYPSEVMPAPISRPMMLAPRAFACSSVSIAIMRSGFAEYKAVAVLVEWSARAGRVVVVGGQQILVAERGHGHRFDLGLDAAADRHVSLTEHDVAPRQRDRLGAGGAGRHRRQDPGLRAAFQPDRRGRRIGHRLLHAHRRNRPHAPLQEVVVDVDELLESSPSRFRWTPSSGGCRPRASRRCPTVAVRPALRSSAGREIDAALSGSGTGRSPRADAHRCGPAARTCRRTRLPVGECRSARHAASPRWCRHRRPARSSSRLR